MIIRSRVKDFYDYLQYQYGQDDSIIWDRDIPERYAKIEKEDEDSFHVFCHCGGNLEPDIPWYRSSPSEKAYGNIRYNIETAFNPMYISILGNLYIVSNSHFYTYKDHITSCHNYPDTENPNYKKIFRYLDYSTYCELNRIDRILSSRYRSRSENYDEKYFNEAIANYRNNCRDILLDLHRELKQPILNIKGWKKTGNTYSDIYEFRVCKKYLPLQSIPGLVSVIGSPEKLYKDIYNFFIEVRDNIDLNPPVEISNKDKIIESGFDLKTSFRNPIRISQLEKR